MPEPHKVVYIKVVKLFNAHLLITAMFYEFIILNPKLDLQTLKNQLF